MNIKEKYWNMIKCNSGVVFIQGAPGTAKSALMREIAKDHGLEYMDLRLAMRDETDVGVYPVLNELDGLNVLSYAVPEWAVQANKKPTLVHFEELNRASHQVRNAALQLLLERTIGTDFAFNDNVFMVASGNLGEKDGTEVEEFDTALNGRLIHCMHNMRLEEWLDMYANDNVHPYIVSFLKNNPEHYYKRVENSNAYANPRSWTFLSDYLKINEIADENFGEVIGFVGQSYVGPSSVNFQRYVTDLLRLNVNDILERYDEIEESLKTAERSKRSELLTSLKEMSVDTFDDKKLKNVIKFLNILADDELISYLFHVYDNIFVASSEEDSHITDKEKEIARQIIAPWHELMDEVINRPSEYIDESKESEDDSVNDSEDENPENGESDQESEDDSVNDS